MKKSRDSKGFTLIELIVTIAVLGILVLLAAPKFTGYVEDARIAQIKNDVKAHENHIEPKLAMESNYTENWGFIGGQQLQEMRGSKKLYDKKGLIEESSEVTFNQENKIIPNKLINTKLKGVFILGSDGLVYYYDGEVEVVERNTCEDAEKQGYICIYTIEDMQNIENNMSAKYMLMNDLDLGSIASWKPIGHIDDEVAPFTGEFNGNNYAIKNLKINDGWGSYSYGLFSDVSNAVFKDVNMVSFTIEANDNRPYFLGMLAGRASDSTSFENIAVNGAKLSGSNLNYSGFIVAKSIDSSFTNVSISDSEMNAGAFVGGVSGESLNSNYKNISIVNSKVAGRSSFVGGVVGNTKSDTVDSFNASNLNVSGGSFTGGVIGFASSGVNKISNVKLEGSVRGASSFTGGVVGTNGGELNITGAIINADLSGGDFVGGLVGSVGSSNDEGAKNIIFENIEVNATIKISPEEQAKGKELFASGGITGVIYVANGTEVKMKNIKTAGEIHAKENMGGLVGYIDDRNNYAGEKTFIFEDVVSSVNFIETVGIDGSPGYFKVGGIVGSIPSWGEIMLDLKNVVYDGNMGLSEFYEVSESNPIQASMWRLISPIVSYDRLNNDGVYEEYIADWHSVIKTDNVYWVETNSPRLKPLDVLNLGK